jgi:hypothetical protein
MMGGTVLAGSVTTLGSALLMFACQLSFFAKMVRCCTDRAVPRCHAAVPSSGSAVTSLGRRC